MPKSGTPSGRKNSHGPGSAKSRKAGTGSAGAKATPPAASVAAAQKLLASVGRKEAHLRAALKREKATLKTVEKAASRHRDQLKSLKSDLDAVGHQHKQVSKKL